MTYENDYRDADGNPLWEPLAKVNGIEASDRMRSRVEELEARKKELEDELGAFIDADEKRDRVAELEREVAQLETELEGERARRDAATDKRSGDMDPIKSPTRPPSRRGSARPQRTSTTTWSDGSRTARAATCGKHTT